MDIKISFNVFSSALAYADIDEKVAYLKGVKDEVIEDIQKALLKREEVHEDFEMRQVSLAFRGKEIDAEVCKAINGSYFPLLNECKIKVD